MTSKLRNRATAAPKGAAEIFATVAPFFLNRVAKTNVFSSPAESVECPKGKYDRSYRLENCYNRWNRVDGIWLGGELQGAVIYL